MGSPEENGGNVDVYCGFWEGKVSQDFVDMCKACKYLECVNEEELQNFLG